MILKLIIAFCQYICFITLGWNVAALDAFEDIGNPEDIVKCTQSALHLAKNQSFSANVWIKMGETTPALVQVSLFSDFPNAAEKICSDHKVPTSECQTAIINLMYEVHFILYLKMVDVLVSFLNCHGVDINQVDPHSAMYPSKIGFLYKIASQQEIKRICEVGFNMGHSALCFLIANPNARVLSLDTAHNTHEGVAFGAHAADFLSTIFPERFFLVAGKSQKTIPSLKSLMRRSKCDMIYVDGSHEYEDINADLNNLKLLAQKSGHILVADDVNFEGVNKAWTERVKSGIIQELNIMNDSQEWYETEDGKWGACYQSKLQQISPLADSAPAMIDLLVPLDWEPGEWTHGKCEKGTSFTWDTAVGVGVYTFRDLQ